MYNNTKYNVEIKMGKMKTRELLDAKALAVPIPISEAERKEAIRQSKLIEYLGIIEYFDGYTDLDDYEFEYTDMDYSDLSYDEFLDVFVPSNYKDRIEYENDMFNASMAIYSGNRLPQDLFNKLLKARIERNEIEKQYFSNQL